MLGTGFCVTQSDAWGNTWQIATHKEDLSPDEIRARMNRGK